MQHVCATRDWAARRIKKPDASLRRKNHAAIFASSEEEPLTRQPTGDQR